MDNLAHTLLGLTLAKAGLERSTPLATTALIISSNLPDVDALARLDGGTPAYLEYHRGFTHGFVGVAILAAALTAVLTLLDRRFRLRSDPFRRPILPSRIFLLSCLGGLGHAFLDFTNVYGVRPFEPFSGHWLYGDVVYVVDPWIWLILGSAALWQTTRGPLRKLAWGIVGLMLSYIVAFALRRPSTSQPSVPDASRIIWFIALGVIIVIAVFRAGRSTATSARAALFVLALFYAGAWTAHRTAVNQVLSALPVEGVTQLSAWPVPADPTIWQTAIKAGSSLFYGKVNLRTKRTEWQQIQSLEPDIETALRRSPDARIFLDFARYLDASVEERSGGYSVRLRDLRFSLHLNAELDRDLNVQSAEVAWY